MYIAFHKREPLEKEKKRFWTTMNAKLATLNIKSYIRVFFCEFLCTCIDAPKFKRCTLKGIILDQCTLFFLVAGPLNH